ncbi:hypothetical protein B6N58_00345 [Legionella micdadei]|uniref:Uncharacterized protein n=2 Tax=Legionella micdadei TaxID=451 RepID=A0A098GBU3_LEGMI|nr:hypothetical protein B6N58_00345 [Legionella micdadei]ARG99015.1 hypothetical protein B6V88_00345 [Legionella micdadei]KTD29079.1 hypothetical protein Lmic_0999 [Legionella micdadei]CEG59442.1 protein of unknown function [coiled-coil domain] [Legionella micdadei]SCX90080.1 hypothetical protein SAMN02982997_00313 [Legionella micdadei]
MPFNIELLSQKDNISIKLQVVGKVINIYFNGEAQAALAARQNWTHLEGHFVDSIQELGSEEAVSLTSGVYHLKKEHTNEWERTIYHSHTPYKVEVTPELFSSYLHLFYEQQESHGEEYQFFQDSNEVLAITKAFAVYYQAYKGSAMEREYVSGTVLTEDEQKEHKKDVEEALSKQKQEQMERELATRRLITMLISSSPVFTSRAEKREIRLDEDAKFGCSLM